MLDFSSSSTICRPINNTKHDTKNIETIIAFVIFQLNTDFKTVCRKRGYPECSDRMFNMWPEVALKLIDRSNKKHGTSSLV